MDLTDSTGMGSHLDLGATVPQFAAATRAMPATFPDIGTKANEAASIDFTPGVYGSPSRGAATGS